jgi:hypothetical protein
MIDGPLQRRKRGCPILVAVFATEPALSEVEGVGILTSSKNAAPALFLSGLTEALVIPRSKATRNLLVSCPGEQQIPPPRRGLLPIRARTRVIVEELKRNPQAQCDI